jgi:hypothetical protein
MENEGCGCRLDSLRTLLEGLKGKTVIIISDSGDKETVEIEGIIGNLLVSNVKEGFKFTLISCLCSVIASCDDLLDTAFASIMNS